MGTKSVTPQNLKRTRGYSRKESPVKLSMQNIELNIPQPELLINTHRSSNFHLEQHEQISFGISVSNHPSKPLTAVKKNRQTHKSKKASQFAMSGKARWYRYKDI